MGPTRFERVTSRLSAVRSTWLSYGPDPHFALMIPLITVSLLCHPLPQLGAGNAGFEKNILLLLGQEYAASFNQALIDHDPGIRFWIFDRLKSRED